MTTIGNIGIGLLIVIVLWLVTLCVFVYSVQIRSNIGWIALLVASVITVTLVVIPTQPKEDKQVDIDILERDYTTIYKQFLLCFLISSALLACILFFFTHCIEPIKDNDEFLSKVMNSDNPVIVNFHAEWCEPCHILTPKLTELIEHKNDIDLATIDVEKHAELAHLFEVKAVPAVLAIKNGLVVDKFIGLVDANMIENLINKLDYKKS